jgi:hypothetical protein
MTPSRRKSLAAFLVAGAILVFLLPFSLMLLPNPAPKPVKDLSAEPTGVYLGIGATTYHVFPYAAPQETFPGNVAVAGLDTTVLVKYRNLADASQYALRAFPGGDEVAVKRDVRAPDHILCLRPLALKPGQYYVTVAREGMYGGTDYVYFSVETTAR